MENCYLPSGLSLVFLFFPFYFHPFPSFPFISRENQFNKVILRKRKTIVFLQLCLIFSLSFLFSFIFLSFQREEILKKWKAIIFLYSSLKIFPFFLQLLITDEDIFFCPVTCFPENDTLTSVLLLLFLMRTIFLLSSYFFP